MLAAGVQTEAPAAIILTPRNGLFMVTWKTETRKPEPPPKKFFVLVFAAIIIALFFVMPVDAGAQVAPDPTAWPTDYCYVDENGNPVCFSGINDQTPTPDSFVPTETPTATPWLAPPPLPTATATPTITIRPLRRYVYLSLIQR